MSLVSGDLGRSGTCASRASAVVVAGRGAVVVAGGPAWCSRRAGRGGSGGRAGMVLVQGGARWSWRAVVWQGQGCGGKARWSARTGVRRAGRGGDAGGLWGSAERP